VRGASSALLAALIAAACSRGGGGSALNTTLPPTVPTSVAPATAVLVLDGVAHRFSVACAPGGPSTTAPGVTVTFSLTGTADDGSTLSMRRDETQGATLTTTDTVTYVSGPDALEAQRAQFADRFVDLRQPDVSEPLLNIDGDTVTGNGVFGPPGATATNSKLVDGRFIARC